MEFIIGNGLYFKDLEDTIDKASLLLMSFRGMIAKIEIIKNVIAGALLLLFCIFVVVVGLET
jgi:hypothetical protein